VHYIIIASFSYIIIQGSFDNQNCCYRPTGRIMTVLLSLHVSCRFELQLGETFNITSNALIRMTHRVSHSSTSFCGITKGQLQYAKSALQLVFCYTNVRLSVRQASALCKNPATYKGCFIRCVTTATLSLRSRSMLLHAA
jgi:hypothetical protein